MIRPRAFVAAGLLCIAAAPAAAPAAAGTSDVGQVVVDRTTRDPRITEVSGLAVSPNHPGVLWTHNDSGNAPVLYALGPSGAVAASVRLTGVADEDWEAIAAYRDAAGHSMIAVGDTGDNRARRPWVQIVILPEPALRNATVTPSRVLRLSYPDGPVDAEALLVDAPAGRMYVVTKGLGGTVYQVPEGIWPGRPGAPARDVGTLVRIATVPLILVTDGVMGPGHHPLLRTYGDLAVLPPITDDVVGGTLQPLAVAALPAEPQGEGLALRDDQVLLASEGHDQPILRMPLPRDFAAVLAAPRSGTATGRAAAGQARAASGASPSTAVGRSPLATGMSRAVSLPALGVAVLLAALVGAVMGRRHRRPHP